MTEEFVESAPAFDPGPERTPVRARELCEKLLFLHEAYVIRDRARKTVEVAKELVHPTVEVDSGLKRVAHLLKERVAQDPAGKARFGRQHLSESALELSFSNQVPHLLLEYRCEDLELFSQSTANFPFEPALDLPDALPAHADEGPKVFEGLSGRPQSALLKNGLLSCGERLQNARETNDREGGKSTRTIDQRFELECFKFRRDPDPGGQTNQIGMERRGKTRGAVEFPGRSKQGAKNLADLIPGFLCFVLFRRSGVLAVRPRFDGVTTFTGVGSSASNAVSQEGLEPNNKVFDGLVTKVRDTQNIGHRKGTVAVGKAIPPKGIASTDGEG